MTRYFSFDEGVSWHQDPSAWKTFREENVEKIKRGIDWLPSWEEEIERSRREIMRAFNIPPVALGQVFIERSNAEYYIKMQSALLRWIKQFQENVDDTQTEE